MACNPECVPELLELFQIPLSTRGESWKQAFYAAVLDAPLKNGEPAVFYGPDFFPYMNLQTPEPGEEFEGFCISQLLEHISEHALGVAINSVNSGQQVEWVFTYGDIITYRMFGSFEPDIPAPSLPQQESMQAGERVMIAQPSAEMLPDYVRAAIRRFLTEGLKQEEPGIFLMHRSNQPTQGLVFSLHPEDFESQGKFQEAMQTLAWFLPRHYRATAIPKKSQFSNYFEAL